MHSFHLSKSSKTNSILLHIKIDQEIVNIKLLNNKSNNNYKLLYLYFLNCNINQYLINIYLVFNRILTL